MKDRDRRRTVAVRSFDAPGNSKIVGHDLKWEQERPETPRNPLFGHISIGLIGSNVSTWSIDLRIVLEPAPGQVREALFGSAEQIVQQAKHATMGDDEDASASKGARQVVQSRQGAGNRRFSGLEVRWAAVGFEISGPIAADVVASQTLPLAGVIFSPAGVKFEGRAADNPGDGPAGQSRPVQVTRDDGIEWRAFACDQTTGDAGLLFAKSSEWRVGLALPATERIPLALAVPKNEDSGAALADRR